MEKLWYYGKICGTIEKATVLWKKTIIFLYRKLWNFDLL